MALLSSVLIFSVIGYSQCLRCWMKDPSGGEYSLTASDTFAFCALAFSGEGGRASYALNNASLHHIHYDALFRTMDYGTSGSGKTRAICVLESIIFGLYIDRKDPIEEQTTICLCRENGCNGPNQDISNFLSPLRIK